MTYDGTNLTEVLDSHIRWVIGGGGERADLSGANLRKANLYKVSLHGANLNVAKLRGVNLSEADLSDADLSGADLRVANLSEAYLRGVNLSEANLYGANLHGANLYGANLRGADLSGANLFRTNLRGADLNGADLTRANLYGADLRGAKNVPYIPMACPDTGRFVAWKKARSGKRNVIIKLEIPASAKRSSATSQKCRCDIARVLEIQSIDGETLNTDVAHSSYDESFEYRVGATVTPVEPFNDDRYTECTSGIHFFINRQDAVDY